jgi:hypothetical protein
MCNKQSLNIVFFLFAISITSLAQSIEDCSISNFPSVKFKYQSAKLNKAAKDSLNKVFTIMQKYSSCKFEIFANRTKGTFDWTNDRVHSVTQYLIKKGIAANRLIFSVSQEGEWGIVNFKAHKDL